MLPDSNQQSNTSRTRRMVPPGVLRDGKVMSSTDSRCRSCTLPDSSPARASSSATEPMHSMSLGSSSQRQMGIGVPQKRLRARFQSRAPASQLPKRPVPTCSGTQWICRLLATSFSRRGSTFINQVLNAMYSRGCSVR